MPLASKQGVRKHGPRLMEETGRAKVIRGSRKYVQVNFRCASCKAEASRMQSFLHGGSLVCYGATTQVIVSRRVADIMEAPTAIVEKTPDERLQAARKNVDFAQRDVQNLREDLDRAERRLQRFILDEAEAESVVTAQAMAQV